jgi:putative inorganic carbon (HCO3(-)) transporter
MRKAARWVADAEMLVVLALAPGFLFPRATLTPWLMVVIPLLWACRWIARGRLTVRTPLDRPIFVLLCMVPVGWYATFDQAISFPKLAGVVYGVALFYALVNWARDRGQLRTATAFLLVAGLAVTAAILVGTRWPTGKIPVLQRYVEPVRSRLPALLRGIPRAEKGFNANQAAGTLALLIPFVAALLVHGASRRRGSKCWGLATLGRTLVLLAMVAALALTESRQTYAATAIALLLLAATMGRGARIAVTIILALGLGMLLYLGPGQVARTLIYVGRAETLAEYSSWAKRVETWERSMRVIRDHPLTGIGFDGLFEVIHARYPTFVIPAGRDHTHAHNVFLQVALDLGLPGLVGFVWLIVAYAWMMWEVYRRSSDRLRLMAAGLFLGLLAQLLYGLANAATLFQKPGVFTWAYFGLGAALWSVVAAEGQTGGYSAQRPEGASLVPRPHRSTEVRTHLPGTDRDEMHVLDSRETPAQSQASVDTAEVEQGPWPPEGGPVPLPK